MQYTSTRMHACMHACIHMQTYTHIHTCVHPSHPSIHPSIHPLTHPSTHPTTHPPTHPPTYSHKHHFIASRSFEICVYSTHVHTRIHAHLFVLSRVNVCVCVCVLDARSLVQADRYSRAQHTSWMSFSRFGNKIRSRRTEAIKALSPADVGQR